MKTKAVQRLLGIYLTAEENPGKPQLGDRLKAMRIVVASNKILYFQLRSVGSHSMSWKRKSIPDRRFSCHPFHNEATTIGLRLLCDSLFTP